jgi:predicted DNA-binding transcriptional regulator AlpA
MSPDELAQLSEVAEILGVSRRTAARSVDRDGFPAPVDVLATGRVWRRRDVEAWARKNPPRGRGRPKQER